MDIDMPKVTGIEGVKILHRLFPDTLIIMQTVFEDDDKIFDSILADAHGYILKKASPEKLIQGIHDVVSGGSQMSATIACRVPELFCEAVRQQVQKTSAALEREIEVLALLVKGLP